VRYIPVAYEARHLPCLETAAGFCAIAWNEAGIIRLQLPASCAAATERYLRRRLRGAEPGIPPLAVADAIAAVKRYFTGQQCDFSEVRLDLGKQDEFFTRVYAAARRIGWARPPPMALWPDNSAPILQPPVTSARPWREIRSR